MGADGKAQAAQVGVDAGGGLHPAQLGLLADLLPQQGLPGQAGAPGGPGEGLTRAALDAEGAALALALLHRRVPGQGCIGDQAGQAHRTAIRPGDQQAALAHPAQPRPGGHRLVGQRGRPAIILDHGRSGLGPGPVARLLQEVRPPGHDPVQLGIEGVVSLIIGPGGGGLQRPDQIPGQGHQHRHPGLQPRGDQPPEVRHPHLGRPFRRQTAEEFLFQFLCLLHRCCLLPVFLRIHHPRFPVQGFSKQHQGPPPGRRRPLAVGKRISAGSSGDRSSPRTPAVQSAGDWERRSRRWRRSPRCPAPCPPPPPSPPGR